MNNKQTYVRLSFLELKNLTLKNYNLWNLTSKPNRFSIVNMVIQFFIFYTYMPITSLVALYLKCHFFSPEIRQSFRPFFFGI